MTAKSQAWQMHKDLKHGAQNKTGEYNLMVVLLVYVLRAFLFLFCLFYFVLISQNKIELKTKFEFSGHFNMQYLI